MSSTLTYADGIAGLRCTESTRRRARRLAAASSPAEQRGAADSGGLRLTARGRLVAVLALLALAFAVFTFVGSPAASTATSHHATSPTVVVQPGQTLWDIAAEAAPRSDPRDVIAEIIELNDLVDPGAIRAGQPLFVPAE